MTFIHSERSQMDYDEFTELVEAYRERFRNGDISEDAFRKFLGRNGFNATDIDAEVRENDLG